MPKPLEVASISCTPQSQAPPRANPADLSGEVLQLQGEMSMALEQLLMTKATMDSHQRELALNTNIAMHQNEAQATEAIKEAEMCQKRQRSAVLLWSRRERPIMLSMPVPLNNPTRKAC